MELGFLSFVIWIRNKYTWLSVLYLLCISYVSTGELCLLSRYNIFIAATDTQMQYLATQVWQNLGFH
jgi:hypothetical protein